MASSDVIHGRFTNIHVFDNVEPLVVLKQLESSGALRVFLYQSIPLEEQYNDVITESIKASQDMLVNRLGKAVVLKH
jgi:beta-lactamase class A